MGGGQGHARGRRNPGGGLRARPPQLVPALSDDHADARRAAAPLPLLRLAVVAAAPARPAVAVARRTARPAARRIHLPRLRVHGVLRVQRKRARAAQLPAQRSHPVACHSCCGRGWIPPLRLRRGRGWPVRTRRFQVEVGSQARAAFQVREPTTQIAGSAGAGDGRPARRSGRVEGHAPRGHRGYRSSRISMAVSAPEQRRHRRPARRLALLGGMTTWGDCAEALRLLADPRRLVQGPELARYEREFAARIGVAHAVSFAHGRIGLYAILQGLGVGPGHEVLVPVPTHVVVANAVRYTGGYPSGASDALPSSAPRRRRRSPRRWAAWRSRTTRPSPRASPACRRAAHGRSAAWWRV